MDLNLSREKIRFAKKVLDTEISHEETMEMIVPDVQPDIFRVLDVYATAFIRSKDTEPGKVTVSGAAAVTVIYFEEDEVSLSKVKLELPFSVTAYEDEIDFDSKVAAKISVASVDASIINTRKFVVKANFRTAVMCFNEEETEICSGVETSDDMGIELLGGELETCPYTRIKEKTFTIAEELSLPSSKPDIGEILNTKVNLSAGDARLIGNKLILKGTVFVSLLYIADGNDLESVDFETEFSQIMEFEELNEDCGFDIITMLTGAFFNVNSLLSTEKRTVTAELSAVAQCISYERKNMSFIQDVYSTKFVLEETAADITIENRGKRSVINNNMRHEIKTQNNITEIIAVTAQTGAVFVSDADNASVLSAPVNISCIYKCDDGQLLSAKGCFETEVNTKMSGAKNLFATCGCGTDIYAAIVGGDIEVRGSVDFIITEGESSAINAITDISYSEDEVIDTSEMASVTIARIKKDATFWKLAKKHHSTPDIIMNANDIESESDLLEGKMLIIPKKR